ncbi:MAG TPA: PqqD family protein [Gemmatimonadales bacterium]
MTRYQRSPEIEAAPMQDEAVLFNPVTKKFCVLNETAAFLWKLLEHPRSEDDLSSQLCSEFEGVDAPLAAQDVQKTLRQFAELKIVVPV